MSPHGAPSTRRTINRGQRGSAIINSMNPSSVPTCASCRQLIRGPFISAVGKIWCPNHFVCAHPSCGISLEDIGFVEENGQLYCERDFEKYFAPRCNKCQASIVGECCYALEKAFHPECFTCAHWFVAISSIFFYSQKIQTNFIKVSKKLAQELFTLKMDYHIVREILTNCLARNVQGASLL